MINLSPTSFNDNRIRIDFGKLLLRTTLQKFSFVLYKFQKFIIYDYKLAYKLSHWSIYSKTKRAHLFGI